MPVQSLDALLSLMARLRDPATGCPWDIEQTYLSIAPYTIEEGYEVADAAERGDVQALKEELGDLLLQVVFFSQIATERGDFTFAEVAQAICDKMVRRHPHVYGDASNASAADVNDTWEKNKVAERAAKAASKGLSASVLDDVPVTLPALTRAEKLGKRMQRAGFFWDTREKIMAKIHEEIAELQVEVAAENQALAEEEFGDLMFVMTRLAHSLNIDPETALRKANAKVERRFRHVERKLAEAGQSTAESNLERMLELWQDAKRQEKLTKVA